MTERTFDVTWFETMLRAAAQKDTASVLEQFLNHELPDLLPPGELTKEESFHSRRTRKVMTLSGPIQLTRAYYLGPQGGRCPLDERLGLHHQYTPAVAQLMCWAAAMDDSFQLGEQTLERFAGLSIPGRQVQRMVKLCAPRAEKWNVERPGNDKCNPVDIINIQTDMTGIPMRPEELKDIKGKYPDGKAKTRQIKVGCVFTQSIGEDGEPSRDPFSTTYLTEFCEPNEHANSLWNEALKRGYASAREKVFLGDGAEWIWNIASGRFKDAVQIVDFYHACEHLHSVCKLLERDELHVHSLFKKWRKRLKNNGLPKLLHEIEQRAETLAPQARQNVLDELPYFRKNIHRMTYRTFRNKGYFIGSGAIEGACRHIVAQRAKLSGMRWLRPGVHNVLVFRAIIKSGTFDAFCNSWQDVA